MIVTKTSGFSPSLTALFLRRSLRCYLAGNMKDASLLLGSIDSKGLLALGLSISGLDSSEVLEISDVPDVEAIGASACSVI